MSRQQLKRWARPLLVRLSEAVGRGFGGPAFSLCVQAHLPAHQPTPLQPGANA
ncbi:hypothetical protein ACG02S_13995 [Roseateles sp. DC23W]|uniref:Uncharacterized protein n=1 Tax=Pelomonas dachongensis TaxID=3299029 RepID=A0ABW7EPB3_9BURK